MIPHAISDLSIAATAGIAGGVPEVICFDDGSPVADAADWALRRNELIQTLAGHVYGRVSPGAVRSMRVERRENDAVALDGKARRRRYSVIATDRQGIDHALDVLAYLPPSRPAAFFAGVNFHGNYTTTDDPAVPLTRGWVPADKGPMPPQNSATEARRGLQKQRWCIEQAVRAGLGVITVYAGDAAPDYSGGLDHPLAAALREGSPAFPPGAIAMWAWALSRAVDCLKSDADSADAPVVAIGHSRMGKAALWAAATDPRIDACAPMQSGCCGAALARRRQGETYVDIARFTHWFTPMFYQRYATPTGEFDCPTDAHELLALIAPRPLMVCSARDDTWADPAGEHASVLLAAKVYDLLGESVPSSADMPASGVVPDTRLGYFIRDGKHEVTSQDWSALIEWARAQVVPPGGNTAGQ